ncbi:heparan sulfate 2-O-sulfotransferase hst-2-like [Bacillus rossius redtenbacheri]|uniref:heparan sulfate 2-O-sulfotransferase hst-2-like n=1 Tax=Bacillus rossius redtenbacheri TaxID=93214 RepID=UPI002FDCDF59
MSPPSLLARRRSGHSRLLLCAALATTAWSLVVLHLKISEARRGASAAVVVGPDHPTSTEAARVARAPTRSMEEGRMSAARPSDHVVFFNRVPKAGGEMLVLLLQWLQGANGFRHVRLGGGHVRRLSRLQQEDLVEEVTMAVRRQAVPVSFDRHVYFLNFSRFDRQSPTFINLVRDPAEKALSRYYYARATANPRNPDLKAAPTQATPRRRPDDDGSFEACVAEQRAECSFAAGRHYDLAIPYFCGHEEFCTELDNERALSVAMDNVERYFPVVGVLEELNATLAVLESTLSYFFKGVQRLYFDELLEPHKNRNRKKPAEISPGTRSKLESSLRLEYVFHRWLRSRLLRQHGSRTSEGAPRIAKYLGPDGTKRPPGLGPVGNSL